MGVRRIAFVTGGTGFVGSHLVEELLSRGFAEVRCLVRSELRWLDGMPVTLVRGTLFDEDTVREALDRVSHVFHVGAVTRATHWEVFERENVLASLHLMDAVADAAPDVERVLVTSTLAVVGHCDANMPDEDAPLRPISMYGRSKVQMERAIRDVYRDVLPVTVIRPSSVYGPREADIYTMFQAANRGIFPIVGSGRRPEISLVHVKDLVRGMADASESPTTSGNTYFIGSERGYSWREVHRAMQVALGRRSLAIPVPPILVPAVGAASEAVGRIRGSYPPLNREKAREALGASKMCSVTRAQDDFGFESRISLEAGFAETVAWYRRHGWL